MAITFDGDNLLITLDSGIVEVNVVTDLYKAWKDFMLASPVNRKYPEAFRSDGGNPLTVTINQGAYIFLNNIDGWRIKPPEEDITIFLVGNLAVEDVALPSIVPTTGNFTAAILGLQPITQGVDVLVNTLTNSVTNLQFLIESLRKEHSAFGTIHYWDPVAGSDLNNGLTPTTAHKTFAAAQIHITAGNSDVVFIVHTTGTALVITERITITKSTTILRGPGQSVLFQPVDDIGPTISVQTSGVSLSGFKATSTGATPQPVIECINADAVSIEDVLIINSTDDGIHINNSIGPSVKNCTIESCVSHGLHFTDCINGKIFDNRIQKSTGYGIALEQTISTRDNWIARNAFHHNGPGSILLNTNVLMTVISKDNFFGPRPGSVGGDNVIDNGSISTHNEYQDFKDMISDSVWNTIVEPQGGYTAKDVQNIGLAALAGEVIVSPDGNTITFSTPDGVITRMVSTTDSNGNRTAVALTPAA